MTHLPLLGHTDPHAVVCFRPAAHHSAPHNEILNQPISQPITVRAFLHEARALAAVLEATPGAFVINLCQDRTRFLLGFAAVLLAGKTNLFPPNDSAESLKQLHAQFPGAFSLHDRSPWPHPHPALAWPETLGTELPQEGAPAGAAFEMPHLPADHLAAWVFTSGSTGQPVGYRKTWGKLWQNIVAGRSALGLSATHHLVGTVPPQHMYGFESLVLLCLIGGCPLWCGKPFYPADILDALRALPRPRQLVTTPYHLNTLLESVLPLPPVDQLLLATAPLEPALAARAEQAFNAPLREIYGSTETGQIAPRRPAHTDVWRLFPGVTLVADDAEDPSRFRAEGGHIEQPVALADHLTCLPDGQFRLLGRVADQVNLAGKRSALSFLSAQLKAIPGVLDGVFFQPEDHSVRGARLCALVIAPSPTIESLLAALRPRLDPVFLPRPLILVDALPYNATGKLPKSALVAALAAHRAAATTGGARLCLPPETPLFAGHFPGNPLVPGALLLDWFLGEAQKALRCDRPALSIEQAKFLHPVRPDDRVEYRLEPYDSAVAMPESAPESSPESAPQRWRFSLHTAERTVVSGSLRRRA